MKKAAINHDHSSFTPEVSEEYVLRTLQKMLDADVVVQQMQRVDFNRRVKILQAEWDKFHEIGLWEF